MKSANSTQLFIKMRRDPNQQNNQIHAEILSYENQIARTS